jgi:polysaccharide biosynthesis protein PslH
MKEVALSIHQFDPDVIVYDTVRTGQFLLRNRTSEVRHVLYMDDLFSIRYERILDASRDYPSVSRDALGNFAAKLPSIFMAIYEHSNWLRKSLLRFERDLICATENRCPSQFDECLLVSQVEAETLRNRTGAMNINDLPPRLEGSIPFMNRTWKGDPEFVFLGNLNLSHNAFGIEHFLENEFESILRSIPKLRLLIAGKGASNNLVRLAGRFPGHVELMGFVENLDAVLMRSCAMLSPLLFGSGVKIKAIDALRCGVPLISTAAGIEGISIEGSVGIRVVKTTAEFTSAMLDLLDRETNTIASRVNLDAFRRRYSRSIVDKIYESTLLAPSPKTI